MVQQYYILSIVILDSVVLRNGVLLLIPLVLHTCLCFGGSVGQAVCLTVYTHIPDLSESIYVNFG